MATKTLPKATPKLKKLPPSKPNSVAKGSSNGHSSNPFLPLFQSQEQKKELLRLSTAKERILKLKNLREAILSSQKSIQDALQLDFRKSQEEVDLTEILPVISEINDAIRNLPDWMRTKPVHTPITLLGNESEIQYEPKGVCLVIAPWNYPFHLAFAPIAAAVAAGNAIILKPSEFTPATTKVCKDILSQVFSSDEVAVVEGDASASTALLELPFDHIFFTGSTMVGKIVMAAAAKHLTSVTLELGGKSPTLVAPDADLKFAAKKILWGKFVNAGQTCVAPDYLMIPEDMISKFTEEAKKVIKEFFRDTPESSPDYCRLVNDRNFARVKSYLDEAKSKGAKILLGGSSDSKTRFMEPTVISSVPRDSKILEEEIFGPLLPIVTYKSLDEAVQYINSKPKPLALYVFTQKEKTVQFVLKRTSSGGVVVNDVMVHLTNPNLPFGGVNHSGHGSYHGLHGFKAFSHERSILRAPKRTMVQLMYPPYGPRVRKLANLVLRWFV